MIYRLAPRPPMAHSPSKRRVDVGAVCDGRDSVSPTFAHLFMFLSVAPLSRARHCDASPPARQEHRHARSIRAPSLAKRRLQNLFFTLRSPVQGEQEQEQDQERPGAIHKCWTQEQKLYSQIHWMADESIRTVLDKLMPRFQPDGRAGAYAIHPAERPARPEHQESSQEKYRQPS